MMVKIQQRDTIYTPVPSLQAANYDITVHLELGFTIYMTTTLQQMIDERISFLNEQINPNNKPEVNSIFQLQIDNISRSVDDDIEKMESVILQKKGTIKE
jgi:hypothetical protein